MVASEVVLRTVADTVAAGSVALATAAVALTPLAWSTPVAVAASLPSPPRIVVVTWLRASMKPYTDPLREVPL